MNTQKSETQLQLERQVQSIANDLSNGIELNREDYEHILEETGQDEGDMMYASDYLSDCLDIKYIVNSDMTYSAAKVLVAFGGPNIWINTDTMQVEGYWWGDTAFASFNDEIGIDDYLEEYFECCKG